jgi:alkylated DNA repair dioxygenase AlkB
LVKGACIASVSFGAVRNFHFENIATKEKLKVPLQSGSLCLMLYVFGVE